MATEATPYKEGAGWAIRLRHKGCDIYVSGQAIHTRSGGNARKGHRVLLTQSGCPDAETD